MKYIIDIEDEYTKDWVTETPMCKKLCMPISVPNRQRTYHVVTGFKLEPYTEPDRNTIENAQEEAWEFAKQVSIMKPEDKEKCWGTAKGNTINLGYHYKEAKAAYDKWKKQKDEVHVGDEVYDHTISETGIVTNVKNKNMVGIMWNDGSVNNDVLVEDLQKTGRHFDEIEELLKKMKEEEE